jgi:hypothetical protein
MTETMNKFVVMHQCLDELQIKNKIQKKPFDIK